MIAVAMALGWASYTLILWGYCLVKGYNIGVVQLVNPVHVYTGAWPPGKAGNVTIIPDGSKNSALNAEFEADTTSSLTPGPGGTTSANANSSGGGVAAAAKQFGWDKGAQWNCLQKLLQNESSGGNPNAYNASATCGGGFHAYGAFQSCSHGGCGGSGCGHDEYCGYGLTPAQTKQANCGNLYYQAIWGMNYIKQTYGSPCNIPGITSGTYRGY